MIIEPAIDLKDGKVVRLLKGDFDTVHKVAEDPVATAQAFAAAGAKYIHMVDLDGAKAGHIVNYKMLEKVAGHTGLTIDFGGGLKRDEDLRIAFDCGAQMVTGGSIAVKNPDSFLSWLKQYGSERIILGADAKDRKIAVNGWEEGTALDLIPFIQDYQEKGIRKIICTDIGRDGMLQGPAVDLYKEIQEQVSDIYVSQENYPLFGYQRGKNGKRNQLREFQRRR